MKNTSDVTALIIDNGIFLPVAQKLSEQYKRTLFWNPWETAMPKIQNAIIGDGFEGLEKCLDIFTVLNEVDLFVFLDVGYGGLQKYLASLGKPVFGHLGGDILETNRGLFLRTLKELGMEAPKYEIARGLTELRAMLKDVEDKYVKASKWRGDFETLHWKSWREDESTLDEYAYKLGTAKDLITFYVFDPIPTDIEDGIDSYCIGGEFPNTVMHGLELKDKAYLCSIQEMGEIDERVRQVNEMFSPVLKKYDYRGFFSTEVRISGNKGFFIDPTCRCGSPPSQVMTELFSNLGEIIWQGANGNLIEPIPAAKHGVQALMTVDREDCEWMVMDIPKEIRRWVKCGFAADIDDRICEPPHCLCHTAGWMVGIGDTIEEAIDNIKEHVSQLPDGIDCDVDSIAKLLIEAESAKEEGIEFSDKPIPEPATVLE